MAPKDDLTQRLDQLESRLDKLDPPPPPEPTPLETLAGAVETLAKECEAHRAETENRLTELEQAHAEASGEMVEHISDYLLQAGVAPRKQTQWHRLGSFLWHAASLAAMIGVGYLLLIHFHGLGAK